MQPWADVLGKANLGRKRIRYFYIAFAAQPAILSRSTLITGKSIER